MNQSNEFQRNKDNAWDSECPKEHNTNANNFRRQLSPSSTLSKKQFESPKSTHHSLFKSSVSVTNPHFTPWRAHIHMNNQVHNRTVDEESTQDPCLQRAQRQSLPTHHMPDLKDKFWKWGNDISLVWIQRHTAWTGITSMGSSILLFARRREDNW